MDDDFEGPSTEAGRTPRRVERLTRRSWATVVWLAKRIALLLVVLLVGRGVYEFLIVPILDDHDPVLAFMALWLLSAYVLLPRVQRLLTKIYVPDYFVGRARTSEGLLGDPINLALDGSEAALLAAMTEAGWKRADDLTFRTGLRIAAAAVLRRHYPTAPVSPLFLFSRRQDLAFEQEIVSKPSHRHHVRFWRCPKGWYLPGGLEVEWVGAATYDRKVGFSTFTLQITHKIGENIDLERDRVIRTMQDTGRVGSVRWVQNYFSGYRAHNGGGDAISTDGNLPVIDLRLPLTVAHGNRTE